MAFAGSYLPKTRYGIAFSHEFGILHRHETEKQLFKKNLSSSGGGGGGGGVGAGPSADGGIGSNGSQIANNDEFTESHYLGVLDTDLTSLTAGQKNFFIITVTILCLLSLVGNVSTLVVNVRRKIRPFFRACLISLAFSDLVNTVFLSLAYLCQFMEEYVQTWRLGSMMCSLVPFATTAAILASSMTLVGIAVDRYYAVMKALIAFWNPTVISCIVSMLCIWLASIGISSPVFTIYNLQPVYILTEVEQQPTEVSLAAAKTTIASMRGPVLTTGLANKTTTAAGEQWQGNSTQENPTYTLVKQQQLVDMCFSEQKDVSLYYIIVFLIIFLPCIGAFFWFNIIIARKIWIRRHSPNGMKTKNQSCTKPTAQEKHHTPSLCQKGQRTGPNTLSAAKQNCRCGSSHTTSTAMAIGGAASNSLAATTKTRLNQPKPSNHSNFTNVTSDNSREARHLRMFTVILLMMAVFVFLRLPAWIFLLMRLYGSYNETRHWILYFAFGIMNLTSSVLNPLFYTFLTETIQYALRIKAQCSALICGSHCSKCRGFCRPRWRGEEADEETIEKVRDNSCSCKDFCGCCIALQDAWEKFKFQKQGQTAARDHAGQVSGANDLFAKDSRDDRDEGVDCSEEDISDTHIYNYRIYTIYPESLVSSSINSK